MSNQLLLRRRTMVAVKRPNYLKFTALEDGCTLALNKVGSPTDHPIEYSLNKGWFVPYVFGTTLTFNEGDTIEWRRAIGYESDVFSKSASNYYKFVSSGNILGSGLMTTLLTYGGKGVTNLSDYCFYSILTGTNNPNTFIEWPFEDTFISIGSYALAGNDRITGNPKLENVVTLYCAAMMDCSGLTGPLRIPNVIGNLGGRGVVYTGAGKVFKNCTKLTGDLIVPNGVKRLEDDSNWNNGCYQNCSGFNGNLILPEGLEYIGTHSFYNCRNLNGIVHFPMSLTNVRAQAFANTNLQIENIICPNANLEVLNIALQNFVGENTKCVVKQITLGDGTNFGINNTIVLNGFLKNSRTSLLGSRVKSFRIGGNYTTQTSYQNMGDLRITAPIQFFEIIGNTNFNQAPTNRIISSNLTEEINVVHLGYDGIATTAYSISPEKCGIIYVGDGSSSLHDESILDTYLADNDWGQYSAKLAKWFDYHGQYMTYKVVDSLTNCTNSNPVVFPFITRGDAYECVISADDGNTLQSVTVTMMDTDNTSQTYGQQIDITSNVYDASTGTISIPSVTGNIEITANAN